MHYKVILGLALATTSMVGLTPRASLGQLPEPVTAFVNVSVIPMDRERVLRGQTVLVRGERIMALGPARTVQVPAAAVRIDGRGKFLIPGLADMHVHVPGRRFLGQLKQGPLDTAGLAAAARELLLTVANGVTTVRIMHGWADHLTLRARAARGELLSPRLYIARRAIELDGGLDGSPEQRANLVVTDVEAAKAAGYDFYKAHGQIRGTVEFDSLVAATHRVGLPLVGHAPDSGTGPRPIERAIRGGYVSIEHLGTFGHFLTHETDNYVKLAEHLPEVRALATAMRRAGVWFCPTVATTELPDTNLPDLWARESRYYSPAFLARVLAGREPPSEDEIRQGPRQVGGLQQVFTTLQAAGVGLLLGTDEDAFKYGLPGFAVHRELWTLVRAGLTPYQALATGTRNVAEFLGTLDSAGTVAVGKRADLVLLSGNPLHEIRHTAEPAGVMLGGRWLDRAELESRLRTLEGAVGGYRDRGQ